jgi:hypothetical protein
MAMVGHKTEAIYRRYAIVSTSDLTRAARQTRRDGGQRYGHSPRQSSARDGFNVAFSLERISKVGYRFQEVPADE